ncbi:MAG: UbiX family flavin prenyltransferase [Gammaproteobacteria bacterium]|nr:UbiX family flavin prenyltransferase [Gammaproteobacteria bacterium]MCW8922112.1 UbiX family flavin prenyltransferase [Gammaproteobacteria bacterium]
MSVNTPAQTTIALGITGASGVQYSFRLLEQLLKADCKVYLMVSKAAQVVIGMEMALSLPGRAADMQHFLSEKYQVAEGQLRVFSEDEWTAPVASGSNDVNAMVVCPCSMGALSAIACGASNNLLERAADVVLKERKKLILVPRETPYSDIHLENMLKLSRMDAVIVDANPGFYNQPKSVDDLVDFVVGKILDQLGVGHELLPRWGE